MTVKLYLFVIVLNKVNAVNLKMSCKFVRHSPITLYLQNNVFMFSGRLKVFIVALEKCNHLKLFFILVIIFYIVIQKNPINYFW